MYNNPIITILIITTALLCASSNTWILLWTILEINTLAFSSWSANNTNNTSETTINYAIIQISASAIILITAIQSENINNIENYSSIIILLTSCINIGASPLHSWFINISNNSEWNQFIVLATIQNIPPILILSITNTNAIELIFISTTAIPTISQINSNTTNEIISSSSVFNSSWLISSSILSTNTIAVIGLTYITSIIPITNLSSTSNNINNQENSPSSWENLIISINIAGMPPTVNFMGNLCVINSISSNQLNPLATAIITTSTVNLIIYLQASSSSISGSNNSNNNELNENTNIPIAATIPIMIITISGQTNSLDSTN